MDVMCLMGLFPNGYEEEIAKNSLFGMQNAANKLQWGIVHGLDAQPGYSVQICNSLYIGSYPRKYRKARIPTFKFEHIPGADDVNIGFLNLPFVKRISRYVGVKKYVKRWAEKENEQEKVLLVYALTTPFTQLASYFQKKYPKIKVCMVVPDLPEHMNPGAMQEKGVYEALKKAEIAWLKRCVRNVRYYVLLTDAMKDWFDHAMEYTVVEGIASVDNDSNWPEKKEKTILYAGGIKREYGVMELMEAFMQIDMPEWKLVIYGDGADMHEARKIAMKDERITLMGMQKNATVVEHQKRASLLVNPRRNQEFTKYSFPSKILEYMASGTPVLAYKLDGVPAEYTPYYYCIPDCSDGMRAALNEAMLLTEEERNAAGWRAREFIRENKTPFKQVKRMDELLRRG